MVHGHEFRAVGKGRLDLYFTDHLGHALHDLVATQHRRAEAHAVSYTHLDVYKRQGLTSVSVTVAGAMLMPAVVGTRLGLERRLLCLLYTSVTNNGSAFVGA